MKNKEFTKVYEGLQSLIRVAMGDSVSNDTYFEFKKYFRYPGELLERMEQYGYGSADDYLSAIAALRWAKNRKLDISEMCVGTQLEDFLKKAEEKGKEENDLLLLYSVICYENDATGYALSADGMWRQHSWLIHRKPRSNRVVETTEPRILYFGFAMTLEHCEKFVSYNVW